MSWQWVGHPISLLFGAAVITAVVSSVAPPLPKLTLRLAGRECDGTFLATVAGAGVLSVILFISSILLVIPNGAIIAIMWPAVLVETLTTGRRVLRIIDVALASLLAIVLWGLAIAFAISYLGWPKP